MNTQRLCLWGALLAIAISAEAKGVTPIAVEEDFSKRLLNDGVVVWEEPSGSPMPPDSVRLLPDSVFAPVASKSFLFGLTETARWLKFRIVNPTPDRRYLLLEVANPNLRDVRVYQYWERENLLLQTDSTGVDHPFWKRPLPSQNFLFPIYLKADDSITCLIYIAPSRQPANFDLYLWQRHYRNNEQAARETLALGGFFLVHFVFLMMLLAVAASFRLRELWYYAFYVLLGALFVFIDVGLGYRYLWPSSPYLQTVMPFIAANLYTIAGTQFIRVYFNTSRRFPVFDHIFFFAIGISAAFMLFLLFIPLFPLGFVHLLSVLLYGLFLLSSTAFVALFIRAMSKRAHLWSAWFLVGFSLHGAGIVITLLQYLRLMPQFSLPAVLFDLGFPLAFHTQILMMAGMILEIPIVIYIAFARFKYLMRQNQKQAAKLAELRQKSMNDLLAGIESERRRLSQDLHDGLSVSLAAMKMKANLMEVRSKGEDKKAWLEMMSDLETAYDELRRISRNLPPKALFRSGMHGALGEIVQRARTLRPEMDIRYYNNLPLLRLSKPAEINLFRITLELFNNAMKHAEASQLSIQWLHHDDEAVLTVEDNGKGFEPEKTGGDGIGLNNVRNRVAVLGGHMAVDSQAGRGATVVVRIPNEAIFEDAETAPPFKEKRNRPLSFF